jgi:hypothetical protein
MGFVCNSFSRWGLLRATLPGWVACPVPSADPAVSDDADRRASQLVSSPDNGCESGKTTAANVANGRFCYAWRSSEGSTIRIGTYSAMLSGSFVSAGKHMRILPRIDGAANAQTLAGEYGARWCKYTYRLGRT